MDHAQHLFNNSVGIDPPFASPVINQKGTQIAQILQRKSKNLRSSAQSAYYFLPFLFNNAHD